MLIDPVFTQAHHLPKVENPGQSVDISRFSRSQIIVVYCYS